MVTNSSSTNLIIGFAAFGLTLAVASIRLFRRRQARNAAGTLEDEIRVETSIVNDDQSDEEELHDTQETLMTAPSNSRQGKLPLDFFLLVFVLAIPFWLFGGDKLPLPINLPVSALVTFVPMIAASILLYRQYGIKGVQALSKKALDYKKIRNRIWFLPALFLMPLIYFLSFVVMRLTGLPLPDQIQIPLLTTLAFFVMFLIGDIGEELGWTGYAIDPMQSRWGALKASLILGNVWVIWHSIPWIQTGNTPIWIFWQALSSVAARILMVWIYNNTERSVFAATLVHISSNIGWSLFPNYGSHYDPFVTALITWLAAGIVIFGWGPKTLARKSRHYLPFIHLKTK